MNTKSKLKLLISALKTKTAVKSIVKKDVKEVKKKSVHFTMDMNFPNISFRYLQDHLSEDLKQKMVFIGGPTKVGKDQINRIWREEGLQVPEKQPKRGRLWFNDGSCIRLRPEYPNHLWSYDFVADRA